MMKAKLVGESRSRRKHLRRPLTVAACAIPVVALAIVIWLGAFPGGRQAPQYRTEPLNRGEVVRVVTATGALQPLVTVNVGSTVSGPIKSVEVDFNARVKSGQVLARIAPDAFETRVRQLRASLAQAQATATAARADLERYRRIAAAGFSSDQVMIQQQTTVIRADAAVSLAEAELASAKIDLARTVVCSPIDGVVVDRQIDPGQSVAASFQTPTLFKIAQDLSRLQAAISVNEADIGEVRIDQAVRFNVDAFPERSFSGRVAQIRSQGSQSSGVVSYTVIVEADNPGGQLLPGMTANAEIVIESRADALRIPNAALRFKPSNKKLLASAKRLLAVQESKRTRRASASLRPPAGVAPGGFISSAPGTPLPSGALRQLNGTPAVVWVWRNRVTVPVTITTGIATDTYTEMIAGDLRAGDQLIVGEDNPVNDTPSEPMLPEPAGGMRLRITP